jgi:drug/metabolite transporter (DMT)-like permease
LLTIRRKGCVPTQPFRFGAWYVFAALAVVWGSTWFANGALSDYVPPLHAAAGRFSLASLVWLPVILWQRIKLPPARALGFVLLLSLTMIVLPLLLLLWAQPRLSSATVAALFAAMPLLVVLLETKTVPRAAMPASIVGLGAIALLTGASLSLGQAGGAAVVLLAVTSIGASSLLARRELSGVSPVMTAALLLGTAAVLFFLAALLLERGQAVQWTRQALAALFFLAVVGGAAAYAAYFWLLQRLEAYQAVTVQWVEPLVAIFESALIVRLGLPFRMVAGSLIALVCLVLVLRARVEDDDNVSLLGN